MCQEIVRVGLVVGLTKLSLEFKDCTSYENFTQCVYIRFQNSHQLHLAFNILYFDLYHCYVTSNYFSSFKDFCQFFPYIFKFFIQECLIIMRGHRRSIFLTRKNNCLLEFYDFYLQPLTRCVADVYISLPFIFHLHSIPNKHFLNILRLV